MYRCVIVVVPSFMKCITACSYMFHYAISKPVCFIYYIAIVFEHTDCICLTFK